ncbi:MAG: hypothetical protein EA392_14080 [Cryomorphaceae bacterium]|nr:MAG: hypothetical protein EA392_14080 [Cryomorphaceae bacterium]
MILRIFRSNQPVLFAMLIPIGLVLWLPGWWYSTGSIPDLSVLPTLYGLIPIRALLVLGFVFLLLGALVFNQLFQQFDLIERRNQLPGLCFVLAFSWSPALLVYSYFLPGLVFVLLALRRTMQVYRQTWVIREMYDVGVLLGLAALCYLPMTGLLLAGWMSLLVLRPFFWREWMALLSGFLTIVILSVGLYYVFAGATWPDTAMLFAEAPRTKVPATFKYAVAVLFVLLALAATPTFMQSLGRSTMRNRNLRLLLVVFGMVTLLIFPVLYFVFPRQSNLQLVGFPLALMLVYAVADKRVNWIITTLFYVLIAMALVMNIGYIFWNQLL